MVRKSFRDILFLLWKQTNVKVISINPLNYKKIFEIAKDVPQYNELR